MSTSDSTPATHTRTITWQDPRPSAQAAQTMSGFDFLQAIVNGSIPAPPIAVLASLVGQTISLTRTN